MNGTNRYTEAIDKLRELRFKLIRRGGVGIREITEEIGNYIDMFEEKFEHELTTPNTKTKGQE